jgi:hypothetical protein
MSCTSFPLNRSRRLLSARVGAGLSRRQRVGIFSTGTIGISAPALTGVELRVSRGGASRLPDRRSLLSYFAGAGRVGFVTIYRYAKATSALRAALSKRGFTSIEDLSGSLLATEPDRYRIRPSMR